METRKFNSEIRAGQSQGDELVLVGRAVTYGAVSGAIPKQFGGYFREVVKPGAFAQSLKNDDQTADWNHDDHKLPLGRKSAGTLQLSDSDTGLNFRIQLDPRQPEHIALHSSVKRGDVRSCSWAFVPNDGGEQWSTAKDENGSYDLRTLTNVKLFSVSVVNNPAYPTGTIVQARTATAVQNVNRNHKSYQEQEIARTGIDKALETLRGLRYAAEVRAEEARERLHKSDAALDKALRDKALRYSPLSVEAASEQGQAGDPQQTFRCGVASMSSTAEEHRASAKLHQCRADRSKNADDYAWHATAADDHKAAADGDVEAQRRVVKRCNRDYK